MELLFSLTMASPTRSMFSIPDSATIMILESSMESKSHSGFSTSCEAMYLK